MIYLLVGQNNLSKENKISEIKSQALSFKEAISFDYDVLHAHRLDSDVLKKSLISLPTIAKKRVVLMRQFDDITPQCKKIILETFSQVKDSLILILDIEQLSAKDAFVKQLGSEATILNFGNKRKVSVFDLTKAIAAKSKAESLKLLYEILESGDHPLQIIGAIVWGWKKLRSRMSAEKFQEGLASLRETDFSIKRSRLKPEYALEVLVVKLCS